jgi:hypothetical protein
MVPQSVKSAYFMEKTSSLGRYYTAKKNFLYIKNMKRILKITILLIFKLSNQKQLQLGSLHYHEETCDSWRLSLLIHTNENQIKYNAVGRHPKPPLINL